MVCSAHEVLMKGLMKRAAHQTRLRQHGEDVTAHSPLLPYFTHIYPAGGRVTSLFNNALTQYADYVSALGAINTEAHTTQIFLLAAWLLFKVVDVHPFVDGNGRLARLLANLVLAMIFPFPVPIYAAAVELVDEPDTIDVRMELVVARAAVSLRPWVEPRRVRDFGRLNLLLLLKACRFRPDVKDQPMEMCALLLENGWSHWQAAFAALPAELL